MYNNIILATSEDQDKASTFAQQIGSSLIAVSSTACLEQNGVLSETKSSSTLCEVCELKIKEGYSVSEIEGDFSKIGKMIDAQTYVISWAGDDYSTLCRFAEDLNRISDLNVWIVGEDGLVRFLPKP